MGRDPDPRLIELLEAARAEWPGLFVEAEVFLRYCEERLPEGVVLADAAGGLHASDLYLACACAVGDGGALRAFRDRYLARLRRVAANASRSELADDIAQRVMVRLLVSQDGAPPGITKYAGRGSLSGWLDVTATREARSALRRAAPDLEPDDEIERLAMRTLDARVDPELEGIKHAYRLEFKVAFEKAFAKLEQRERNVLRLEHLDGLDGARIAALYGVNKSSVSRWRAQARETLYRETRNALQIALKLRPQELGSVLRLIESKLDASLSRILRDEE